MAEAVEETEVAVEAITGATTTTTVAAVEEPVMEHMVIKIVAIVIGAIIWAITGATIVLEEEVTAAVEAVEAVEATIRLKD
jgi:hypothetical protein